MKILIYSSNSIYSGKPVGGAEHSLALLAKGLAERGEEVHFLTRESGKRLSKSRIESIDGVKVHFLLNFSIPFQRAKLLKRLNEWIYKQYLFRYLSKHFSGFDIALGYNEYPDVYYILKWKRIFGLGIKTIVLVVGFYWHFGIGLKSDRLKKIITEVYNRVDLVNFISTSQEKTFWNLNSDYEYNFNIQSSFVLDIGVPAPNIPIQKKYSNDFQVVMVSRFAKLSKNQKLLIQAFRVANISNSKLLLIGEGETKKGLINYCMNDKFLSSRVSFTGYINNSEINQYLAKSTLFCLCSSYEGVPKATLEAMYSGLPVLVSDIEAYKDIVIDNHNGFLVENTVEQWSAKILDIHEIHLSKSLGTISSNAKAFVSSNYDDRVNSIRYQEEFRKLIE